MRQHFGGLVEATVVRRTGRSSQSRRERVMHEKLIREARKIFGDEITEIIITGKLSHRIGLERAAKQLSPERFAALHDAVSIAKDMIREDEALGTIQAWFIGMNPMLNDEPPALVVGRRTPAVRRAAEHLLVYG